MPGRYQNKKKNISFANIWRKSLLGITSFDLSAHVTSPGGVTEDAVINEVKDGLYAVHFVPKELGVHTVSVKYKEIHIPGNLNK